MKIMSLITHPHDIFDEFRELSDPPIDSKDHMYVCMYVCTYVRGYVVYIQIKA